MLRGNAMSVRRVPYLVLLGLEAGVEGGLVGRRQGAAPQAHLRHQLHEHREQLPEARVAHPAPCRINNDQRSVTLYINKVQQ